ncbi:MAG: SDR family NAD(P)-dependent oxidoreductase [Planctomycetes bacterium]|nr:SDR family NAD(P)-dependent oxidoreductase [Planctomycetota bacterium]
MSASAGMHGGRPVALVTGASAGIGAACVKVFAAAGWDVAAAARRTEKLDEIAQAVTAEVPGATILPLRCDVNSDDSVKDAFDAFRKRFGKLDALVNNAGYGVYGSVEETPLERFRANMETNYFGVLRCTQSALPLLREAAKGNRRRWGAAIVMVSSFVGRRALPGMASYCASKFALEGLSEALRIELADERVAVSVVNPGVTQTDFFKTAEGARPKGYLPPASGMSSEAVARVIFSAARRPRRNAYLTAAGKAGIAAQWLSPRLLDWIMKDNWAKSRKS